ncbi:MAG: ABC transporter permease, partial [Vicinamibacteria bacterium]
MSGRVYRLLLRLYPSELRRAHEREMVELAEHYRSRGLGWLLVLDLLTSLPVAHWRAARPTKHTERRSEVLFSVGKEIAFAFRNLGRAPTVTLPAVVTLALGIGANTAIFSVVNAVALRPLPYPEPDRLTTVWSTHRTRGSLSQPDLRDIQAESRSLEALAGYSGTGFTLTGMGPPEVVQGTMVTDGLLKAFGLKPVLGRDLEASESVPGGPRVAVIAYGFWQERFGGAHPLGKTLTLDGELYEIVGVAPPGFDFPDGAQVFRPLYLDTEDCGRGCHLLRSVGRLSEGSSTLEAGRELSLLASRLELEHPKTNTGKGFELVALEDYLVGGDVRIALFVLLAAVGVVLLIACANVAHLLLARASDRSSEMAVRSALGASGSRLLRQLLLEALAMSIVSAIAGVAVGAWGLRFLLSLAPSSLPRMEQVSLDETVLVSALVTTLFVTLAFGLAPALDLSRSSLAGAIGHGGRTARRSSRFREAILAAQVGLCLCLL